VKDLKADYFEFFDLPRSAALDAKDLEKRFYSLSRQLHPDLYARKSQAERDYAQEASALLNDAYRTLKDPIARAMYLLKLEGFDIGEQGGSDSQKQDVPPELLEEMFELNMMLEEADPEEIGAARVRFEAMRAAIDSELQEKFAHWNGNEVRSLLNRRKYVTNLIDKTNVPD